MKRRSTIFYPEFEKEIARSEYQRTQLIIGLFLIAFIAINTNYFFLDDKVTALYGGAENYFFVVGWLTVFILYEVIILRVIAFLRKRYHRVRETFRFIHTLIEISLPSVLMLYMVDIKHQLLFIDSPIFLMYFMFIIISVLHLDFRLSFLTGLLAAAEYAVIIYYGHQLDTQAETYLSLLPENSFYLRCVVLVLSGMAAGYVAQQVKKRIYMSYDLQRAKSDMEVLFGQQVSREVFTALVREQGKAKKQEATVLALDIRNFTPFAETHSPDEIMDYQNKIFGPIIDIINQHQGIVNQILGDGIMATFGTPVENPLHADMAFEAALQILRKVNKLCEEGVIPLTKLGMGVHTGDVITGNIGNESRKQYSISGSAVIIAFRVEQLNKQFQSELLITDAVKSRITAGRVQMSSLGKQPMKGFGTEVEIYKVEA
ncbi:MAG TPA: adenylate/guanylate cyclase domain-containing protein [Cyclobacteriaceae bacterium]|nr:adenylate/guanylate cyclase domain-containing protein [Cyclobacteriaceae bacterium]HMV09738.1 adenylate/guanylate cyclase domain-containing protein [Cyclobacteriaceae bacterium]HMV90470.1 adenylate/guanylate cyclase domain-containing protein [Cyclobacteriaceae bacterium]HMX02291.1 adenylate/guanylate cyclase domain-containing protein [Cyclobacteriaceae bacterium]HMX51168.1 adenylate/guanylate cyclase domain-containing protein [Cyclobacteriaceae bacterium]